MYTEKELYSELRRYFKEEKCSEDIILSVRDDVISIINEKNINTACLKIRRFVELPDKKGNPLYSKKTRLPYWIKLLVFIKIYQILDDPDCPTTQSSLLKDMGLPPDIFREKHWDMYSPDLKVKQNKYENIHFLFAHAEVESNEIFRAMIHHMIRWSKESTDTFVDMFGKLGIIPLFCAEGYSNREIWINTERNYKSMMIFKKAMQKPVKVIKRIKEIQRELLKINDDDKRVAELYRYLGLAAAMSYTISGLDSQTIESVCEDKKAPLIELVCDDEKTPLFNIYDFAAYYIIQNIIAPSYWKVRNLTDIKDGGTTYIRATLKDVPAEDIVKFAKACFDDASEEIYSEQEEDAAGIRRYANALKAKGCKISYVDVKEYLEYPHNMRALLYIDPPKYLREEKRFQFGYDDYCNLFAMLRVYEGDWILAWKNYVEVPPSRASENIYAGLYTQDRVEQDDDWIGEEDDSIPQFRRNDMRKLYAMLEEINKQRSIYVFRFKFNHNDSRHPNSILFFTTIDFPDVNGEDLNVEKENVKVLNIEEFNSKYGVIHTTDKGCVGDPELKKTSYNEFYLNSTRTKGIL